MVKFCKNHVISSRGGGGGAILDRGGSSLNDGCSGNVEFV